MEFDLEISKNMALIVIKIEIFLRIFFEFDKKPVNYTNERLRNLDRLN